MSDVNMILNIESESMIMSIRMLLNIIFKDCAALLLAQCGQRRASKQWLMLARNDGG